MSGIDPLDFNLALQSYFELYEEKAQPKIPIVQPSRKINKFEKNTYRHSL